MTTHVSVAPVEVQVDRRAVYRRVNLMGMPIDVVRQVDVLSHIATALDHDCGGWVITPNLDQLRLYCKHPELHPLYDEATLILADGMPLVWASKIAGRPLPERVAGSSLVLPLCALAAETGHRVFLLGGNPGAADAAAEKLKELNPALRIAGTYCPEVGFEKDPAKLAHIREAILAAHPDVILVGLGFPKQEKLIRELRRAYPRAWYLGIGISFSFICGEVRRAPLWMQRCGLEWLHRMMQEPGRLFKRYIVHDLPFAARLFTHAAMMRLRLK